MDLQADEARRVRIALVEYVEKVLKGEEANREFFSSALHSLDLMMHRANKG